LVDGIAQRNVDAANCSFSVPDTQFDPTASDGTCSYTLTHNYTGMTGYPWANKNTLSGAHFPVGTTTIVWTVTDASFNTFTRSYNITVTDNIAPTINDRADTIYPYCQITRKLRLPIVSDNCGVDSVICNLTGDYNWWPNINSGETQTFSTYTFDPLAATTVTWTVFDINGSSASDPHVVTFTVPIDTIATFEVENVQCHDSIDGRIVLDFVGGKSPYYITVGSVFTEPAGAGTHYEINNLQPSPYTITIRDADNCQQQFNVAVGEPDPITASYTSVGNVCFENSNGSLDIAIQGGNGNNTYLWSGPTYNYADGHPWHAPPVVVLPSTEDQTGLNTGRYSVVVTDARSCSSTFTFDIPSTDITAPAYSLPTSTVVNSNTGTCTYTVSGNEFDPVAVSDACEYIVWHNYRPIP